MEAQRVQPIILKLQRADDPVHASREKRRPLSVVEVNAAIAKVQRNLEALETAVQAAKRKLVLKMEKRVLAQAAEAAKRYEAKLSVERRKQQGELKLLNQVKIRRLRQILFDKELRVEMMIEVKRKMEEEALEAKAQKTALRKKETELRRQHAKILKQQENERLKQEKSEKNRLNKEREQELERLEQEMVKKQNNPTEDLCLPDQKVLPMLSRLPGLLLSDDCFADCLMVMQFLRCFGKVLCLDSGTELPTLHMLQEGLLNQNPGAAQLQDLLIRLLSAAVCDPGLPRGQMAKTALGKHISSVQINRENVSEILQLYMAAHCSHTKLSPLVESLRTKVFQAHTPAQKASMLAFLVNELTGSKSVIEEIDKNKDNMKKLRREKRAIKGNLRKLKSTHAKQTRKRENCEGDEENQALGTPTTKRKRKLGGSKGINNEHNYCIVQREEDKCKEGEKKRKRTETCKKEDDGAQTASVVELEEQIETLTEQKLQIGCELFESSHSLRSMMFGQDRFKRLYWALPHCGGVFVESGADPQSPALVKGKSQDLPSPRSIPQEMLTGWWKVSSTEDLTCIMKACHPCGIRESVLSKRIQKHKVNMAHVCAENEDAAVIDMSELEQIQADTSTSSSKSGEKKRRKRKREESLNTANTVKKAKTTL